MPLETALVADDSKSARLMLCKMLKKIGLEVESVESGEDAIAYLDKNDFPDVVFMDHMMPGMDGLEATKQITSNDKTKNIPIFMYTGKERGEYEQTVLESGAYGMLEKPTSQVKLRAVLQELSANIDAESKNKALIEEISSNISNKAVDEAISPLNERLNRLENSILEQKNQLQELISLQKTLESRQNEFEAKNNKEVENQADIKKDMQDKVSKSDMVESLNELTERLQQQFSEEIGVLKEMLEDQAMVNSVSGGSLLETESDALESEINALESEIDVLETESDVLVSDTDVVVSETDAKETESDVKQKLDKETDSDQSRPQKIISGIRSIDVNDPLTLAQIAVVISTVAFVISFVF